MDRPLTASPWGQGGRWGQMGACPLAPPCSTCPHWGARWEPRRWQRAWGSGRTACDRGVHKTPSRTWTLGLTSLLGRALPNPRTREPGRAHPALSSGGPVTLPRPLSPLSPAPGCLLPGPWDTPGHDHHPRAPRCPRGQPPAPRRPDGATAGLHGSRRGGGRAPFPASEHPWEAPPGLGAGTRQSHHRQRESGTPGEPGRNTAPRRGLQHRSHPPSAINKPV